MLLFIPWNGTCSKPLQQAIAMQASKPAFDKLAPQVKQVERLPNRLSILRGGVAW
jgi:hypothetical protein